MEVRVKLMGMLKDKAPAGCTIELPDGAAVEDALRELEIAPDGVNVVMVNGRVQRDPQAVLAADDELTVLPPVGGG